MLENVPRVKRIQPKTVVNWQKRDELMCGQVVTVAQQIKNAPGKPKRVTFFAMNREIRARMNLYIDPGKTPLTRLALQDVIETREQFTLRRIHYVAKCFAADSTAPSRSDFLRAAGINPQRKMTESIMGAIHGALAGISCAAENRVHLL